MVDPFRHLLTTDVADAVEVEVESLEDDGSSVEPISITQSEDINDGRGDETDSEFMNDADSEAALALAALSSGTEVFGPMQRSGRSVKSAMGPEVTKRSFYTPSAPPVLIATSRFGGIQSQSQPMPNTSPLTTPDHNPSTAIRTSTAETIAETPTCNAREMFVVPDQRSSSMTESIPHSDATKDVDKREPVTESGDQQARAPLPPPPPFDAMASPSTSGLISMSAITTTTSSSSFYEAEEPLQVQQVTAQRMQSARLSLTSFKGDPAGERDDLHMNEHNRAKDHDVDIELKWTKGGHSRSRPGSISHCTFDGYHGAAHSTIRTGASSPTEHTESYHQPHQLTDQGISYNHSQPHGSYVPLGDAPLDRHISVPSADSGLAKPRRKYNKRSSIPQSMPDLSSTVMPQDQQENELLDSDRGVILKAQIPKKGRPISRHSSTAQSTSALSSFAVPPVIHPYFCSKTGKTSSSLTLSSSNQHLPVRPPDLPRSLPYVDQSTSSMEEPVLHAPIRRRPGRPPLAASVARHTHTQSHSSIQFGAHSPSRTLMQFSEILHDNVYNESRSARKRDPLPLSSAASSTMRSVAAWSQRSSSGGQHRFISSHMDQCGQIHEERLALLRSRPEGSSSKFFAGGLSAQATSRKRSSSGAEMYHPLDEHYPAEYQDGFISSWHDAHEQNQDSSENVRSKKRISRSDASRATYESDDRDEETAVHSWQGSRSELRRPRSLVSSHDRSYRTSTISHRDAKSKYEDDAHLYDRSSRNQAFRCAHSYTSRPMHSRAWSLDNSYSMSASVVGRLGCPFQLRHSASPDCLERPSFPRRCALTATDPHLLPHPSTSTSPPLPLLVTSVHPGRPKSSVPSVPAAQEMPAISAKPAMPEVQAVPSTLSVSSTPSFSISSPKPRLHITLFHASPSFHSSSSIYPSPATPLSPRFESSLGSTPSTLGSTKSSLSTATSSSSPCSYLPSPLYNPGNEYAKSTSDMPRYSIGAKDCGADHESATSSSNVTMTTRADLLAREMSESSYSSITVRSQSGTTPSRIKAPYKRSSKKGSGPYLKKHQILQQQLQELQREQEEMELHLSLQQLQHQQQYKHQRHRQQQHQHQIQRHSIDLGRRRHLQKNFDVFSEQHPHPQQPLPGRPPKQRVMLRSGSSSSVLHNLHAPSQDSQLLHSPTLQHHHRPQSPPLSSTERRQNHQQPILLKPVSLPSLANLAFEAPSSKLSQPPLGQPRYQSLQQSCVVTPSTQVSTASNTNASTNRNSSPRTVWGTGVKSPPDLSRTSSLATSSTLLLSTTPSSSGLGRYNPPHQQQHQQHPHLQPEYQQRSFMTEEDRIISESTFRSCSRGGASTGTSDTTHVGSSSQQSLHPHSSSLPTFHYHSSSQSSPSLQQSYPISQGASSTSRLSVHKSMSITAPSTTPSSSLPLLPPPLPTSSVFLSKGDESIQKLEARAPSKDV